VFDVLDHGFLKNQRPAKESYAMPTGRWPVN